MLPAYISHPDCIMHEMGDDHPEYPERIGVINDLLLARGQSNFMPPHDAPPIAEMRLGHDQSICHVHQPEARVPASDTRVNPDTQMNPYSYQAAFRATVEIVRLRVLKECKLRRLLISAGFDRRREDDMGNPGPVEADCERVTRQAMQVAARHAGAASCPALKVVIVFRHRGAASPSM